MKIELLLSGLHLTLTVTLGAVTIGLLLALCLEYLESQLGHGKVIVRLITGMIRGLPELLVLLLCYFLSVRYTAVSSHFVAVGALGLIYAAYATQVLKSARASIPSGHLEAGAALALSTWQQWRLIIWPQLWRAALPGLSNLMLITLKDSSLVSLIGLTDIMSFTQFAAVYTRKPFECFFLAALAYLGLTVILTCLLRCLPGCKERV